MRAVEGKAVVPPLMMLVDFQNPLCNYGYIIMDICIYVYIHICIIAIN